MFFVSNRDFHRAPNVIVIDADSFPLYFRIFRKLALPPFCCLSDRHSSREKKGPGCWLTRTIETCSIGQQYSRAHKSTGEVCMLFAEIAISRNEHKKLSFSCPFVFSSLVRPLLLAL